MIVIKSRSTSTITRRKGTKLAGFPRVARHRSVFHKSSAAGPLGMEKGKPFTMAGFGNWFRDRCDEAGLLNSAAHGLRSAAATRLADHGATAHQLMAWFGWRTLSEADGYTREANRKRLAASAGQLISGMGIGKLETQFAKTSLNSLK